MIVYFCIIVIDMFYMFMYLLNYIMFVIVMVMPCDIVGDIMAIEILLSIVIIISDIE